MVDVVSLLYTILEGAGVAAFAAAVGYLKAHFGESAEPFDLEKFGTTLALGAVLGGLAGYLGVPVLDAENLLVSLGLFAAVTYFVNAGVRALVRFVQSKLGASA